jgi:hypothetical protein
MQLKKKNSFKLFLSNLIIYLLLLLLTAVASFYWTRQGENKCDKKVEKKNTIEEIVLSEEEKFLKNFYVVKENKKIIELSSSYKTERKKITYLNFSGYNDLVSLNFQDGSLTNLKLPIEGEKLTKLTFNDNQLSDLTVFSHLANLEELYLGNNNFSGTLWPLRNLNKLKELFIVGTKLDRGLEYLPSSVEEFYCDKDSHFSKLLGDAWGNIKINFWMGDRVKLKHNLYEKNQIDEWRNKNLWLIENAEKEVEFENLQKETEFQSLLIQLKSVSQYWISKDEGKTPFIQNFFRIFINDILPERIRVLQEENSKYYSTYFSQLNN